MCYARYLVTLLFSRREGQGSLCCEVSVSRLVHRALQQSTAIIQTNRNVSNGNKKTHRPFSSEPRRCEAEICYRGLVKRLHALTRVLTHENTYTYMQANVCKDSNITHSLSHLHTHSTHSDMQYCAILQLIRAFVDCGNDGSRIPIELHLKRPRGINKNVCHFMAAVGSCYQKSIKENHKMQRFNC